MPAYHSFNEAQTRYGLIDPQLTKRGWNLADRRSVSLEMPVDGYDAAPVNGITDYYSYRGNGKMLTEENMLKTFSLQLGSLNNFLNIC